MLSDYTNKFTEILFAIKNDDMDFIMFIIKTQPMHDTDVSLNNLIISCEKNDLPIDFLYFYGKFNLHDDILYTTLTYSTLVAVYLFGSNNMIQQVSAAIVDSFNDYWPLYGEDSFEMTENCPMFISLPGMPDFSQHTQEINMEFCYGDEHYTGQSDEIVMEDYRPGDEKGTDIKFLHYGYVMNNLMNETIQMFIERISIQRKITSNCDRLQLLVLKNN